MKKSILTLIVIALTASLSAQSFMFNDIEKLSEMTKENRTEKLTKKYGFTLKSSSNSVDVYTDKTEGNEIKFENDKIVYSWPNQSVSKSKRKAISILMMDRNRIYNFNNTMVSQNEDITVFKYNFMMKNNNVVIDLILPNNSYMHHGSITFIK
jgi:hypothetical protein